jgi:hypothetical protein
MVPWFSAVWAERRVPGLVRGVFDRGPPFPHERFVRVTRVEVGAEELSTVERRAADDGLGDAAVVV